MAFIPRPQSPGGNNQGQSPALNAESLLPDVQTSRFEGNTLTLSHTSTKAPKIVWPEKYRERYKLPANIEQQPF